MVTTCDPPPVEIINDRLQVFFDRFDIHAYGRFLELKRLPESSVEFDPERETYTITAPARFATMFGIERPKPAADRLLAEFLFDDQKAIVQMALDAKRFACWSDCGLGKTVIELEFARHVIHRTGGKVLLFTLNEIVNQIIEECQHFYGDALPIVRLESREEMKAWAASDGSGLAITNYEKMNHAKGDQVVNELRKLAGIVLDESSRLKGGGGKQKWALIKSCRGIEYKLSCTATPAPNDIMEFASQASFLERMRNDAEIIWTYFHRDAKTHRWTVKQHARKAFFEFMAGWSIYVRDPRKYGWRLDHAEIPKPVVKVHQIPPTEEQIAALQKLSIDRFGQLSLLQTQDTNTVQRGRLSQIAKGFRYRKKAAGRIVQRIPSKKPAFVADLIKAEVAAGLQVLVWTVFDAESDIIAEHLETLGVQDFDLLTGKVKKGDRPQILERFRRGESKVLIARASMLGYGMNFQCCGSMIFSGWTDSYEAFYQAVRRAYRHGQTKSLRVHLPCIEQLEGDMLENIFSKEAQHEAAIAEMEANYIAASKVLRGG